MRNIKFVKAEIEDLDVAADVLESILPMYRDLLPGAFEKLIRKFRRGYYPINYELWLVYLQDEVIGIMGMESLSKEVVYLAALYLYNDYHRMGLGGEALEILCQSLQNQGYSEIVLFAHKRAYWAIQFYRKHNFQVITTEQREIRRYRQGLLEEYFLPHPVLMARQL